MIAKILQALACASVAASASTMALLPLGMTIEIHHPGIFLVTTMAVPAAVAAVLNLTSETTVPPERLR